MSHSNAAAARQAEFRDLLARFSPSPIKDRREQLIRCPLPDHEDRTPSCSVNLDEAVWNCFGCERRGGLVDLAAAVGAELQDHRPPSRRALHRAAVDAGKDKETTELALKAAQASVPADGTPARAYFASRRVWPPDGVGPPIPASIRWLAPDAIPTPKWPPGAGAILYGLAKGSMQVEAIDMNGEMTNPRFRRNWGPVKGLAFNATPGVGWKSVVICEGPIDALAMRWKYPDARVLSTCGADNTSAVMESLPDGIGKIIIEPDGDKSGRKAARAAREICRRRGFPVDIPWDRCRDGMGDPADRFDGKFGEEKAHTLTAEEVLRQAGYDLPDDDEIDAILKEDAPPKVKPDDILDGFKATAPGVSLPTAAGMVDAMVDKEGAHTYPVHCEAIARQTGWKPEDIKHYHKTGNWRERS